MENLKILYDNDNFITGICNRPPDPIIRVPVLRHDKGINNYLNYSRAQQHRADQNFTKKFEEKFVNISSLEDLMPDVKYETTSSTVNGYIYKVHRIKEFLLINDSSVLSDNEQEECINAYGRLVQCPVYPETLEMESILKRSSLVMDDLNNFRDNLPASSILSRNSSSSSSIRSQSPDFSSSLDTSLSRKSVDIDPKRAEQLRQNALNRSLEEISRELQEIENTFTVAEEILQKEKERDLQLYNRERQRRMPSDEDAEETESKLENDKQKKIQRKKTPPKAKSPTYKIYSSTNRIKSPTFCSSRLYFQNGRIGCADAESVTINSTPTLEMVKQIIKKENDRPLVEYDNVLKVLNEPYVDDDRFYWSFPKEAFDSKNESPISLRSDKSNRSYQSQKSTYRVTQHESPTTAIRLEIEKRLVGKEFDVEKNELPPEGEEDQEEEVGTPIEEEKLSITEPGTVLNEEYRKSGVPIKGDDDDCEKYETINEKKSNEKLNDSSSMSKVPISGHGSLHGYSTRSSQVSLSPDRHQFVRERIRHLVNRFSDRTRRMRHRLEVPPTPSSSMGSTSPVPPPVRIAQNDQINDGMNNRNHAVDCTYWICPIFCGRGHEEDGLDPQGRFYISWLFIVSVSFLYNAWVIPLRSSFPFQTEKNTRVWMILDYCADVIYLLDVIFVKHRLIYLYNGFWQTKRKDTRLNYMKKLQFKMDVLSLMPLDLLYLKYGYFAVFLRCPRLLKIQSFWDFFKLLDRVIASPFMVRVAKTLTYMLYMIHLTACAYYAYSDYQGLGTNRWVFSGKGHPYVRCFAFATKTATSIGKNPKPENDGELMFMTAAWLMGVFVFALLIGQIRDIIATATRSQSEYKQLVDETLEYMRRLKIPADIQRRVKMWFTFTWEQQRTLDESHILDTLPANLKTDIAISVHMQTLSKVQLFAECDEALLRELVLKMRSLTFVPGDYVCKKGEVGKEMYIIKVGEVQVMGGPYGDEVLATLSKGSYFGEISLLAMNGAERNRRTADVRSKGFSNLFVLSKSDLNEALVHYPDAQQILKRRARSLMQKNAAREANRSAAKTEEEPDVVIKNPKRPPSPTPKLISTVMQSLPKESIAVKLLTHGSRKIKSEKTKDQFYSDDEQDFPPTDTSDLLFCIQNELKNKNTSINLTDNEKKFFLRESVSDTCLGTQRDKDDDVDDHSNPEDVKCDVTVHREM